jgi:hypothetical protein
LLDPTPPAGSFSTGPLYTSPLRIYHLTGTFWVYDYKGFLCSTEDPADLVQLLIAESARPTGEGPHFRARDLVHPGTAEALYATYQAARNLPPPSSPSRLSHPVPVSVSLEDLGL